MIDAENAELADEWIVDDLEDIGDHMRGWIGCGGDRIRAFHERWRVGFAGVREQGFGNVQQLLHAGAGACGHKADRQQMSFAQTLFEGIVQLRARQAVFAHIQIVIHHGFVDFHHLVDDLLMPVRHRAKITVTVWCGKTIHHPATAIGRQIERE